MMIVAVVGAGTNVQPRYYPPMSPAHRQYVINISPTYLRVQHCATRYSNAALATCAMCCGSTTLPNHVLDSMLVDAEFR
jgi:hypothetical protein